MGKIKIQDTKLYSYPVFFYKRDNVIKGFRGKRYERTVYNNVSNIYIIKR